MSERDEARGRVAEHLGMHPNDPRIQRAFEEYWEERDRIFDQFPLFTFMMGTALQEGAHGIAAVIEAVAFDVVSLNVYLTDRSMVAISRQKLGALLELLADNEFRYVHDYNFAAWAVVAKLGVELTARTGITRLFGSSRERDMLTRILDDCRRHLDAKRGLPGDLAERLRALENQGVLLPSDVYVAIERSTPKP